jgi:hypothetical protein
MEIIQVLCNMDFPLPNADLLTVTTECPIFQQQRHTDVTLLPEVTSQHPGGRMATLDPSIKKGESFALTGRDTLNRDVPLFPAHIASIRTTTQGHTECLTNSHGVVTPGMNFPPYSW